MDVMFRRIVVLAVALGLTWMVFFGAGYFGAVWTHYFADESEQKNSAEISVKIIKEPMPYVDRSCGKGRPCPQQPKPHE